MQGVLICSWASVPSKPLFLVANSVLCHSEKLSSCVQLIQLVVNGQLWPLALSLEAASNTSGQVLGACWRPGRPLEGVLVVIEDGGGAVERVAQHLAVGAV